MLIPDDNDWNLIMTYVDPIIYFILPIGLGLALLIAIILDKLKPTEESWI